MRLRSSTRARLMIICELHLASTALVWLISATRSEVGVASELAEIHPPTALLLQAPFSSARAMARLIVWPAVVLVWKAISRVHFDTRQVVSDLDVPVSVVHGRRDRIVPVRMGIEVYEAAKRKGKLLLVERAGHSDVPEIAGEDYWRWVDEALSRSH